MIKSRRGCLTLFMRGLFLCAISISIHAEPRKLILAYLETGLNELRHNEKQVAMHMLVNELTKDTNLQMSVQAVKNFSHMQTLIAQQKVDFVIFNSFYYLSYYDFFKQYMTESIWAVQRGSLQRENYILVAHKDDRSRSLAQLRNKKLSAHAQYLLMNFYLEFLVKQVDGQDSQHFFKKIKHTKTASQAVLDVYFGSSDLCIVPKHIFDLTVELNPAIMNRLSIIHQSGELFMPVLAFSFNYVDKATRRRVNTNIQALANSPRGEKILELFNIVAINKAMPEQLEAMHLLFRDYQSVLKK